MYKCLKCENVEFEKYTSLSRHMCRTHKVDTSQFYVDYYLNGIWPLCKCGCGEKVNYSYQLKGFRELCKGHYSRIHNNWGHNPKAIEKSAETRRQQYASGERESWCKGLTKETSPILYDAAQKISQNKERSEKISNALTGKSKSKEQIEKIKKDRKKYWSNPEHREEQSHRRMMYIKKNGLETISKLEDGFAKILDDLKIHYHRQHYVREIKGLFDFYLTDKLFIEIQGDFWHCKPNTKYETPKYDHQRNNIKMDVIKEEWCKNNGVTLLKFWESDIHLIPSEVVRILLDEVKCHS